MLRLTILALCFAALPTAIAAQMSDGMSSADESSGEMEMSQPMQGDVSSMDGEGGMDGMEAPDPLYVYFETGSAKISGDQEMVLDRAVRTFRDGDWIVIEVSGVADTVGDPAQNLTLSLARAQAVANGLMARGVDPVQLQIRARGNSELAVRTDDETPERQNRIAEITWR